MKQINIVWKVIGTVAVCTLFIASTGLAQSARMQSQRQSGPNVEKQQRNRVPGRDFGGGGMMINWAELDLSEEQKEQMSEKRREFQVNTAEIQQKLQFVQQDLRAEMRKDPVDQAKIDGLWDEITALKQQIGEAEANYFLEVRNLLTPEQLEKLRESEATMQELRELKAELREMLLAPGELDAAKVKELQAKIAEKEVALQKERFETLAQKMKSLTPEQRQQMRQSRNKRRR